MPCACKIPVVLYPETAEWGPLAWDILHGLAERAGKGVLIADELRGWVEVLESVRDMIPCDVCRTHYGEYLQHYPVKDIPTMPYAQLKTFVKTWLWRLHNDINQGNDKPLFTYEALSAKYGGIDIPLRIKQLAAPIQRAMQHNGVRLFHWKAFERAVKKQLSYSG